jgi:hypothetical protein
VNPRAPPTEYNDDMGGSPERSLRVARRAARRIMMAGLVRTLGRFLVAGALAGVVAATLAALAWGSTIGIVVAAGCMAAAGVGAVATEFMRARPVLSAAARVDDALEL